MNFPTCRTCVHVEIFSATKYDPEYVFCHWVPTTYGCVKPKPDKFFCSEHETEDGTKFVNFGDNNVQEVVE